VLRKHARLHVRFRSQIFWAVLWKTLCRFGSELHYAGNIERISAVSPILMVRELFNQDLYYVEQSRWVCVGRVKQLVLTRLGYRRRCLNMCIIYPGSRATTSILLSARPQPGCWMTSTSIRRGQAQRPGARWQPSQHTVSHLTNTITSGSQYTLHTLIFNTTRINW